MNIQPDESGGPINSTQLPDGTWGESTPGGLIGPVARLEFWLRNRGWKRLPDLLGRFDERGLGQ